MCERVCVCVLARAPLRMGVKDELHAAAAAAEAGTGAVVVVV